MPYSNGSLRNPQTSPKAKKSCFVSGNRPGQNFHHFTARIVKCVSEYIFFVSNKKTHTHTHRETKSKRNKRNQPRKGERKYVCC